MKQTLKENAMKKFEWSFTLRKTIQLKPQINSSRENSSLSIFWFNYFKYTEENRWKQSMQRIVDNISLENEATRNWTKWIA